MANYFARKAGNINATDVWATTPSGTAGAQTFVAGDVLYANSFAITVNVSTDLGSTGQVRNDNTNGATAGGSFTLSNGVTLTANVYSGTVGGGAGCVQYGGIIGNSATLVGDCFAGATPAVVNSSTGTLNITGNITAGTASNAFGASNGLSGTLNVTGNATGGSGGTGSVNGLNNASTGTVNLTGNATGGSVAPAIGANNNSTGTFNITGNVTGGSIAGASGANNASTGTMTIVGSATATNNAIGARNISTGILNIKRAVGNGWGIGATGIISVAGVDSFVAGSQTRVEEFEFGALGQVPVTGAVSCPDLTTNVCIVHRLGTTKKTLVDSAASANYPAASNVRSGTSYNFGNTTGTLAVPSPSSVAFGVAVDNTTGTAVLTPSAVWNALTSGMTTAGSIGERLKNAATVDTTGQALSDALSPVP